MPNFTSLFSFAKHHRIQQWPRPRETWRLLQQPVVGEVLGLGHCFRGMAVATNGVIVAIETSAGNVLFGHLQWFEKDNPDEESDLDAAKACFPSTKHLRTINEFDDLCV
jgi:hypothetical protein